MEVEHDPGWKMVFLGVTGHFALPCLFLSEGLDLRHPVTIYLVGVL